MIILKLDFDKYDAQTRWNLENMFYHYTKERVLMLPNDIEVLLDASSSELYRIIDDINEIIERKNIIDEM